MSSRLLCAPTARRLRCLRLSYAERSRAARAEPSSRMLSFALSFTSRSRAACQEQEMKDFTGQTCQQRHLRSVQLPYAVLRLAQPRYLLQVGTEMLVCRVTC